ncbi:hypothetical protein JCM16161A_10760 [Vulcanisaeta sp. JCM 16161]|uniref:hypothetical protein n=1 Tax=Vulcanisaeta sp. JCM 16161 TaxID=1295372 RepID=UPI000A640F75|nr:hypothetical protein [Vulcanisaeta sp. JCM 16161]
MNASNRLNECYQYCIKYHSDDSKALQACYSICDALWRQQPLGVDMRTISECFPHGVFELENFMAKYKRVGRSGFDDWQIASYVSSIINEMLNDSERNKCPNAKNIIIKVIIDVLNSLE